MKYSEFKIEDNIIEFHNSIIGKETVYVNGKNISEKYSVFGTKHNFELNKRLFQLKSSCQSFSGIGVNLELSENGNIVEKVNVGLNKQSIIWIIMGVLIGIAAVRIIF